MLHDYKKVIRRPQTENPRRNDLYHVLDASVISDLEFDRLLNELKQIEGDPPDCVTLNSPTLRARAKPTDRFVDWNR
jgi:NAD-dependent DNA ligase